MSLTTAERMVARTWLELPNKEWTIDSLRLSSSQSNIVALSFVNSMYARSYVTRRLEIVGEDYRVYHYKLTSEGLHYLQKQIGMDQKYIPSEIQTLPDYIVVGKWKDPNPEPGKSPRSHPYDWRTAALRRIGAEVRIYPNQTAADAAT